MNADEALAKLRDTPPGALEGVREQLDLERTVELIAGNAIVGLFRGASTASTS